MIDSRRFRLLFGPYRMPSRCRLGGWLRCRLRGEVRITSISAARIQWPMARRKHGGKPFLIVCGDLA
jgi:hypothetical protein